MLMLLSSILALTVANLPDAGCNPVPGLSRIEETKSPKWLIVGEVHGTKETPEAFGDLVCGISDNSSNIVVALELPAEDQRSIEIFMKSNGDRHSVSALLGSTTWRQTDQDGRTSEAMLALLDRLRKLSQSGRIQRVVGFLPAWGGGPQKHEKLMADALLEAAGTEKTRVIVLVGNLHAQNASNSSFIPMAAYLPKNKTITLNVAGNGGSTWECVSGPTGKTSCGAMEMAKPEKMHQRSAYLSSEPGLPYSGWLDLGVKFTASPPAAQQGSSSPH